MNIDSRTTLCAVIGNPVEHSLSPLIHNAAIACHKINAIFLAFKIENPEKAIDAMRTLEIRAFSVTIPFKEAVMPYLDEIDLDAKALCNVNTIINKHGRLKGYNTDVDGVEQSLRGVRIRDRAILLIGAGGVARTIAFVIQRRKGHLTIMNRSSNEARDLREKYGAEVYSLTRIQEIIKKKQPRLIINATPVGMGKFRGKSLVPRFLLKKGMTVFDVIYNPLKTKFICDGRSAGCRVIMGDRLFLGQGARQFELWSGKKAPVNIMERCLYKHLNGEKY